jgi:hypothetical protein
MPEDKVMFLSSKVRKLSSHPAVAKFEQWLDTKVSSMSDEDTWKLDNSQREAHGLPARTFKEFCGE